MLHVYKCTCVVLLQCIYMCNVCMYIYMCELINKYKTYILEMIHIVRRLNYNTKTVMEKKRTKISTDKSTTEK